jgi:hypothetical protein
MLFENRSGGSAIWASQLNRNGLMFVSLDRPGYSEAASIKDKERSADYPEDYLIDTF